VFTDWLLFVPLIVFGFACMLAEHQSNWIQLDLALPTAGLMLSVSRF
jgi:hypothetical protein